MKFIIYENGVDLVRRCKNTILSLLISDDLKYQIDVCDSDSLTTKDENNKVFIVGCDGNKEKGLDIAGKIRENGDWISPIILVDNDNNDGYTDKLLRTESIDINNLEEELRLSIELILKVKYTKKNIFFCYKGECHLIPYDIILYIEKNINDNSSLIVTDKEEICIPKSISVLFDELDKSIFYKSHRSCLINIEKVNSIDYDMGIISFGDKETNLLSRSNKRVLKDVFKNKFNN